MNKVYLKEILKVSAFYLEVLYKFLINLFKPFSLNMPRCIQKMALAVLIFSEGFGHTTY